MKNILLLSIFLSLCTTWAAYPAVNVQSTFITSREGLGNNLVRHVFQDSKGFLWMSTLNGLTRYDGYSFVTYRPNKKDKIPLADYHILNVSEDINKYLWIQVFPYYYSCYDAKRDCFVDFTGCGEYKWKYNNRFETSDGATWLWHEESGCRKVIFKDGEFLSFVYNEENKKLLSNHISKIFEDSKGNVLLATDKGITNIASTGDVYHIARDLHIIDIIEYENKIFMLSREGEVYVKEQDKNDVRSVIKLNTGPHPLTINAFHKVRDKYIVFTLNQTFVLHLSTENLIHDENFDMANARFIDDNRNNLWIYDNIGNIRYINTKTNTVKNIKININYTYSTKWCSIIQDARGLIWIATDGYGLYIHDPVTDDLTHYTYRDEGLNRISSNSLINIMEDKSGTIWIGSGSAGLSHLLVLNDAVRVYPEGKSLINHSNSVRMLSYSKNGEMWIGNRIGSIYKYDYLLRKKQKTLNFPSGIYKMTQDNAGKTWIGSRRNGLCIDGRWYTNEPGNKQSLSNDKIYDIFCDYKQRMWIATFGGGLNLAVPDGDSYIFKHFLSGTIPQQEIRAIASDDNDWMWVGTVNGLCVFHPDSLMASSDNFYRYDYDSGDLPGVEVKSLFFDSRGRMWIGTLGGGFSVCTPENNYGNLHFTHYSTSNGLVNDVVQAIVEDEDRRLWISTEFGISRFTPENETFENFFFSSSTLGNVYNETSALAMPDGRLLFGSEDGLIIVEPRKISSPNIISEIVLTNLKINGIPVYPNEERSPLDKTLNYIDAINLKHNQNSFVIEFSTFDYSITKGTRYKYKLDNFDKDWGEPTTLNFATYKNLSPGKYTLRVRASNTSGIWSEKEALLQIVIAPPFWKSCWAYLMYLVLSITLIYTVFRLAGKFNNLRNRIEIEKQLTDYKLMFFTNISHEFRTPLTLIQGALENIVNTDNSSEEMNYSIQIMSRSTNRMLRLINQLLEFRKMQNNKLKLTLEETDIIAFLNDILFTFEEIANEKAIEFQCLFPISSHKMFIDRSKLDKIIYNLLSNAFKYTPRGGKIKVEVSMDEENSQFIISVTDTGIGIPEEKQQELFSRFMQSSFSNNSVGIGLHLTYELINIHKGNISFTENKPTGSVFTVILPLNASTYKKEDFLIPNVLLDDSFVKERHAEIASTTDNSPHANDLESEDTILIIEDDADIRKFLEMELGKYYNVTGMPDGSSGLEYADKNDIDLIICDVLMPGMNGYEVTRQLKNDFNTSHIPIILLTAMGTMENQVEGAESGADAYITKPFSPKLLRARINQLIGQRRILREKFSSDPTQTEAPLCSTEIDKRFSERLKIVMEKQLSNPDFTVEDFALMMKLGRTIFFRKVKGITGYTPNEYMRIFRMKKAVELLNDGNYNVSEIAYMVGMRTPYYFSKCFKEQFGVPPSIYLKGK